jgi:hypothetical protein
VEATASLHTPIAMHQSKSTSQFLTTIALGLLEEQ